MTKRQMDEQEEDVLIGYFKKFKTSHMDDIDNIDATNIATRASKNDLDNIKIALARIERKLDVLLLSQNLLDKKISAAMEEISAIKKVLGEPELPISDSPYASYIY